MTPDDQQWFAQLTGRPAQVSDHSALKEANLLREALQRIEARAAGTGQDEDAAQAEARLFERLRGEGLLSAAVPVSVTGRTSAKVIPVRPQRWAWAGLAAAAVAAGWLLLWPATLPPPGTGAYDEPPALRGQAPQTTLRRPDPEAFAKELQADLATAGAGLRIYRDKQTWVLDVDVPAERLEQATPVLAAAGIPAATGLTRIVLAAGTP